jgi:hypothetical protein
MGGAQHVTCFKRMRNAYKLWGKPLEKSMHGWMFNLKFVQKGVFYSGVNIYNLLPTSIKCHFRQPKRFKVKLRSFLLEHSLYSLDEYFKINPNETHFTNPRAIVQLEGLCQ